MTSSNPPYDLAPEPPSSVVREGHIEYGFIEKLRSLKYEYRPDIRARASLEANFRQKFEALNRVRLTDSEFSRLMEESFAAFHFDDAIRDLERAGLNKG